VGGLGAAGAAGLHQHVVLLAFLHEGGDTAAAHHRFQRAADVGDAYAEVRGAHAVDVHAHLRPRFLVIGIDREEARMRLHALHHQVAPARDFLVLRPAEHHLDRLPAAAHEAATHSRLRLHAAQGTEFGAQRIGDIGRALLALVPVLEEYDHIAGMHLLACAPTARRAGVVAADRAALLRHAPGEHLLDLLHLLHGVVEARALGPDDGDEERAAVLGRRKL